MNELSKVEIFGSKIVWIVTDENLHFEIS